VLHPSSPQVRRWVVYEFMYPAIDRPFFLRSELTVREALRGSTCGRFKNVNIQNQKN
jgi:hypothetical protein